MLNIWKIEPCLCIKQRRAFLFPFKIPSQIKKKKIDHSSFQDDGWSDVQSGARVQNLEMEFSVYKLLKWKSRRKQICA